jgi:hypothetical protein
MAGLTESYCQSNETSHASQFKWLDNTFNAFFYVRFPFKRVYKVQILWHMNETYSMKSAKLSFSLFQGNVRKGIVT